MSKLGIGIESRFRKVEKLILAAQKKGLDDETASYYSRLGCVLVCGAVERSVEIVITERLGPRSVPQVSTFLRSYFKKGTNYSCEEIEKLLFRLDVVWGNRFQEYLGKSERIKSDIASCYSVRNSIAHGGDLSLGPTILKQYFDSAFTLVVELDAILKS